MTTENLKFDIDRTDCYDAAKEFKELAERSIPGSIRVVLSEDGEIEIYTRRDSAGTFADEWHGVKQAFPIKALSGNYLHQFLTSNNVQNLLEAVHDGHTTEWDGHNHVGVLTDEAEIAREELRGLCEEYQAEDEAYFYEYEDVEYRDTEEW